MNALQQLERLDLKEPLAPVAAGYAPELAWLPVPALRIDASYQRPVSKAGWATIERIARDFSWAKFAPVIVSPATNDTFAIIDGQHRSIAAAARGFEKVPCQIVRLSQEDQAASFAAINGNVTPITPLALYKAELQAGAKWAKTIDRIARSAGVSVAAYPKPVNVIQAGETMAVGILKRELGRRGADIVKGALQGITGSRHNVPGGLSGTVIAVFCDLLNRNAGWRDPERLSKALDQVAGAVPLHIMRKVDLTSFLAHELGKRLGSAGAKPEDPAERDAAIRDLFLRKNKPDIIAARLRLPYADVRASLARQGLVA